MLVCFEWESIPSFAFA